jgi:hypothetical protein
MKFLKGLTETRLMNLDGESSGGGLGSLDAGDLAQSADANETFDNMDYESPASKEAGEKFKEKFKDRIEKAKKARESLDEDEEESPKAKKTEKKEETKAKKGSDIDTLEEKDLAKPEKEDKKEVKEAKEDKEEEKEDEEGKTEEEKKAEAKKLKIRMSDGLYGIESDAKVRVKIDGEFQEVPVQELINNYSGKTAWDKKFTEIGQEKKVLESQKMEITKTQEFLKSTVGEIIKRLDDPNMSPFDALNFLVEKSGRDPYTVWKRSLEANLDEVEALMSMSEPERKAYFLEKKDEFRTKSEEARKAAYAQEESFNQAVQKVDALRQAHGVSEEQYLNALDELEAQGQDTTKMSDEAVVDYASLKPHVDAVQDVLEPYEDSIDDTKYSEVVRNLARQMRAKDFTKEQLSEWARKEFLDEDLKDLTARTKPAPTKSRVEVKQPEKMETLDDW